MEDIILKTGRVSTTSSSYSTFFDQITSALLTHLVISIAPADTNTVNQGRINLRIGDDIYIVGLQLSTTLTIEFPHLQRGTYLRPRTGERIALEYASADNVTTVIYNLLVQLQRVIA